MRDLFSNSFKPFNSNILKQGSYILELTDIRPAKAKQFGDGLPPRRRLTFCFKTTEGVPINRTLTATNNPRGRLMDFIRQMAGDAQPTEVDLSTGERFTSYLAKLIGKRFKANIAPSDDGRFNNILSISSLSEKEAA
jgi:hypothetical protein